MKAGKSKKKPTAPRSTEKLKKPALQAPKTMGKASKAKSGALAKRVGSAPKTVSAAGRKGASKKAAVVAAEPAPQPKIVAKKTRLAVNPIAKEKAATSAGVREKIGERK